MVRAAGEQRPPVPAWAVQLCRAFGAMLEHYERWWMCGCAAERPSLPSALEAFHAELGPACANALASLRWLVELVPPWAAGGCCDWCANVARVAG